LADLLLNSEIVDDFVRRDNGQCQRNELLFLILCLDRIFQRDVAMNRDYLDVVRIGRKVFLTDNGLSNLRGDLTVVLGICLVVSCVDVVLVEDLSRIEN
jgi:hypothetical protein